MDLLISIDDDKPSTTQLPLNVRAELDALFMLTRDNLLVHKAGAETIDGAKTFSANTTNMRAVQITNNAGEAARLRLLQALISQQFDVSVSSAGSFEVVNSTDAVVPFRVVADAIGDALQILASTVKLGVDLDLDGQDLLNVGNANVANGWLKLDGNGRIPTAQLTVDAMQWKGTWNAGTNTPALADGNGSPGDTYRVTVGGTRNLGSGNQTFDVGDWVILSEALVWQKADMTDAVNAVVGLTGNITKTQLLQALDVEIGIDVLAYTSKMAGLSTALDATNPATNAYQYITYNPSLGTFQVFNSYSFSRTMMAQANVADFNNNLITAINPQTGTTFQPALTDAQKLVTLDNAAAIAVTLPSDATVALPIGATINFMWLGVGQPSFVAGSGATIVSDTSKLKIAARYTGATAVKVAANTWWLTGSLIA